MATAKVCSGSLAFQRGVSLLPLRPRVSTRCLNAEVTPSRIKAGLLSIGNVLGGFLVGLPGAFVAVTSIL
jgi:hypothetical protein